MSIKEAKQWIEQFREVAHNAAEKLSVHVSGSSTPKLMGMKY